MSVSESCDPVPGTARETGREARVRPAVHAPGVIDRLAASAVGAGARTPDAAKLLVPVCALSAAVGLVELIDSPHVTAQGLSAAIETSITALALLSVILLVAVFRQTRQLRDLMLLAALACVSLTDFAFNALPALTGFAGTESGAGARVTTQVLVAAMFIAAAAAPTRTLGGPWRRRVAFAVATGVGAVLLAELIKFLTGAGSGGHVAAGPALATVSSHRLAVGAAIVCSDVMVAAGMVFMRREPARHWDAGLLAGASFLLAGAVIESASMPSIGVAWVTPDDGLRLLAYGMLLALALRRCDRLRRASNAAARRDERERLARDLHDGLAQDLATIALYSQGLERQLGPDHPLEVAARRALATSREAIVDLSASSAPTIEAALSEIGRELGRRFGVRVNVQTRGNGGPIDPLDGDDREELVRIAREAIVNAAVHGHAKRIDLLLERTGSTLRLLVSDDGGGMPATPPVRGHHFGLSTMRARAAAIGGTLMMRAGRGDGTEIEVVVPHAFPTPIDTSERSESFRRSQSR